jgi:hypothetical protein
MRKTVIAAALVLASLLLGAGAAHAQNYPDSGSLTPVTPSILPGQANTFFAAVGTFESHETVWITLTGESASGATLAFIRTARETATLGSRPAQQDGALEVEIEFPSTARGEYTLTATGDASGVAVSTTMTVEQTAAGAGPSPVATGAVVVGMVIIVFAAAAILLLVLRRRRRDRQAS